MTEINERMSNNACSRFAVRSVGGNANGSRIATSPTGRRIQDALARGWILYDSECEFCIGLAHHFAKTFHRRGFEFLPLQTPWVARRLGLVSSTRPDEMRVLTSDGRDFAAAKAVVFLARQIWWMWPLFALAQFPGMGRVFDRGYRWVAAHRGCRSDSACNTKHALVGAHRPPLQQASLLMTAGPPAVVWCLRGSLAPWIFMWLMAGAIFLGAKWLTFSRAPKREASLARVLAYFCLWPGMDALTFFATQTRNNRIAIRVFFLPSPGFPSVLRFFSEAHEWARPIYSKAGLEWLVLCSSSISEFSISSPSVGEMPAWPFDRL